MMIMDSSKPLYLQVEADIKNRILSKQYMPGDKLPTENELSDQYNVSKITIRKAIQNLSDEGYVNKVQGKGTTNARTIIWHQFCFLLFFKFLKVLLDTELGVS